MTNKLYRYFLIGLLVVVPASICNAQRFISDEKVRAQVRAIKSNPSDIGQVGAAEDLFEMVKGKDLDDVHSRTIHMISDLISKNDGVTLSIAATLGEFKGRAAFAAPRLIAHLKKVECQRTDASSAFTIRTALKKMGVKAPESACPGVELSRIMQ